MQHNYVSINKVKLVGAIDIREYIRETRATHTFPANSFKGKGRFPFCDVYKATLMRPRFIEHAVGCLSPRTLSLWAILRFSRLKC